MKLVIVESPAKAKTINKYLGSDYKVLASFGHIRDLPSKDGSVRPDEDFAMDYKISDGSTKHVKLIADAAKGADEIFLATDPDREGEAISWHVVEALKQKRALKKSTKVSRIVFHEITKGAVTDAIKHPRDIDMNLVDSQQARRALDYLVGFTLSPVLWRKLPGSRSAGRVQSVALRLICDREEEIEKFISKEYWDVKLDFLTPKNKEFQARLTHLDGKKLEQFDITNESDANKIQKTLESKSYSVAKIEKKQSLRHPKPPFTTSSLQQEASRKLGFSTKKTMLVAQKLYEGIEIGGDTIGLITYMRTDSVAVSKDAVKVARKVISDQYGDKYLPKKERFYKTKTKNAQEAHEAIRPTFINKLPSDIDRYLDQDQKKLYDLIWKRMVSSQMESVVLDQVIVDIKTTDDVASARANGSSIKFDGFYKVYREGRDDDLSEDGDKMLPPISEDDDLELKKVLPEQHFTQPPPRFTEASLVKKLEELGIGRPSTYSSIISVLQDREYVRLEKKRFMAADRGRIVTAFLISFFERYVKYDFTAKLEDELDDISNGDIKWKEVLHNFWNDFNSNISEVSEKTMSDVISELNNLLAHYLFDTDENGEVNRSCSACEDGKLSLKLGKFGAFLGCSNYPECTNTKQLSDQAQSDGGEGTQLANAGNEPRILGKDSVSGLDVLIKKGPYGFYIQLGEDSKDKKPKRTAVPANISPDDVDLQKAIGLLSLPRDVGKHPETGKKIVAGIGRFGPYLRHDSKFVPVKDDDILSIGINRAVALIAASSSNKSAGPLKTLGKHPDSGEDVAVYNGRYGPYVKHKKLNASLPKNSSPDQITLEEALDLLKKQEEKKKKKKK